MKDIKARNWICDHYNGSMANNPEIILADPVLRRRVIFGLVFLTLPLVVCLLTIRDPFEWLFGDLFRDIQKLVKTDPEEARHRLGKILIWTFGFIWLNFAGFCAYCVFLGRRMLKAGRWPLPGARVIRDTRVERGRKLRIRASLIIALPLLVLLPLTYSVLRVLLLANVL